MWSQCKRNSQVAKGARSAIYGQSTNWAIEHTFFERASATTTFSPLATLTVSGSWHANARVSVFVRSFVFIASRVYQHDNTTPSSYHHLYHRYHYLKNAFHCGANTLSTMETTLIDTCAYVAHWPTWSWKSDSTSAKKALPLLSDSCSSSEISPDVFLLRTGPSCFSDSSSFSSKLSSSSSLQPRALFIATKVTAIREHGGWVDIHVTRLLHRKEETSRDKIKPVRKKNKNNTIRAKHPQLSIERNTTHFQTPCLCPLQSLVWLDALNTNIRENLRKKWTYWYIGNNKTCACEHELFSTTRNENGVDVFAVFWSHDRSYKLYNAITRRKHV